MRLLEVVPEDLVQLDELQPVVGQPVREPLVQLGAHCLRERLVRRVADQQVAEAVGVLTRELGLVRADELLADQAGQAALHLRLLRGERLHRATVEDAPLDRAALEHAALGRLELVEPRREQRLDRPRHRDLAVARRLDERDHLLDEERVPLGGVADALSQPLVERRLAQQALEQLVRLRRRERLEQHSRRVQLSAAPAWPAFEQLRPSETEQEDRGRPREVGDMLDQIEESRLRPVDVVEHDHDRCGGGRALEQLAQRPGNLLGGRDGGLVAEQHFDRRGGRRIEVELSGGWQLLQHLDHRPVRDPFPVRQAASAHHARAADRADELGGQARLADAGRPEESEQLARAVRLGLAERLLEAPQLPLTAHELCVEPAGEARRLCLQADQAVGH